MINNFDNKEFLNALIAGNHIKCTEIVNILIDNKIEIKEIYEHFIKNAMYTIGEMWEYGRISVATEHLASAIVEGLLNNFYSQIISKTKINKTVIVSCVENEFHQIGIKMVADIFEMNGWNALFLGANTPTKELVHFIRDNRPDILALSLSIYFHLSILETMIQTIQKEFPKLIILVGGQAFRYGGLDVLTKYQNVIYKPDLNSIELLIKNLNQNG